MGKGHFVSKKAGGFDWEGFQKHMGYSDEQLKAVKNDPKRANFVQKVCSPEMQDKYMIAEVVESNHCPAGMQVGDRIFFKGLQMLDPERGDPWCPYIVNVYWFTLGVRNFFVQGQDLNSFYVNHSGCFDCGPERGLGRVIYKVFAVDKSELDKYEKKGKAK